MPLTREELTRWALEHTSTGEENIRENDCEILLYLLEHCEIRIPEENRFFGTLDCEWILSSVTEKRVKALEDSFSLPKLYPGRDALAYTGCRDFGHTWPNWENILRLGIPGLKARAERHAETETDDSRRSWYNLISRVYDGALALMHRAAEHALAMGKREMAEGLRNLTQRAPETLFEAIQLTLVYYALQHTAEGTALRTMGRLDSLLYSYYIKENSQQAETLLRDYLREMNGFKIPANLPFALGGADAQGRSLANPLSEALLEAYQNERNEYVKLHLFCAADTPRPLIRKALEGVRSGRNSIVFFSDGQVTRSLEKLGAAHTHAANYHAVGCYECGAEEEVTCSCNARVNLPKALELALNGGRDMLTGAQLGPENSGCFETFDVLLAEVHRQTAHLCRCAMALTDAEEALYPYLHSAPFLSSTFDSAMEKGRDVYDGGARYCNSSLNALGLATAADSLAAIRRLVYEERRMTLSRLRELLAGNWQGEEPLRLLIRNRYPKFGCGDAQTDAIAKSIVDTLADTVSGAPNKKGGVWRLGLFSIDWRWEFGAKTAASADGRLSGEPLSQNTGASFGCDREGAAAHLLSAASIDPSRVPNGAIVDIDLHTSAVRGENGLSAMEQALKTYFDLGGFAVHYNVLDAETLRSAKAHPSRYPNLQVRLCGWNVLFSALSEKEQDEFIARFDRN